MIDRVGANADGVGQVNATAVPINVARRRQSPVEIRQSIIVTTAESGSRAMDNTSRCSHEPQPLAIPRCMSRCFCEGPGSIGDSVRRKQRAARAVAFFAPPYLHHRRRLGGSRVVETGLHRQARLFRS